MRDLTVVFDLDGTLVDTAPDLVASTNHVMAHLGLQPITRVQLETYVGHGAVRMIQEAIASQAPRPNEKDVYPLFDVFIDHYSANIAVGSRAFDGVTLALDRLKSGGAKLAVCTNKAERQAKLILEALHLSPYFAVIAGRDTYATCKPHPGHLTETIAAARGHKSRAIMVGDSATDIATARAAGVPVIAVSFGYTDVPVSQLGPDVVINHYDELDAAIEKLASLIAT